MGGVMSLAPLLLRFKWGWVVLLILLGVYFFAGRMGESERAADEPATARPDDELAQFVGFVLDDAQTIWVQKFAERDLNYRKAKLVLFTDATSTGCGYGDAATGPFYCPSDERVYIDLGFYRELSKRFGAPGDFAQAYVVAHEIGHHVQNQLGTSEKVHRAPRSRQIGAEGLSVRLELQADCYAGIWANATGRKKTLEAGDIEEGLAAAAAIGDDRLQRQSRGTVSPESWTHGSSDQRVHWFKTGYESGKMDSCDTFDTAL